MDLDRQRSVAAAVELATSVTARAPLHWGNSAVRKQRNLYGKGVSAPGAGVSAPGARPTSRAGSVGQREETRRPGASQRAASSVECGSTPAGGYVVQTLEIGAEGSKQVMSIPTIGGSQRTVRRPRNEPPKDPQRHMYRLSEPEAEETGDEGVDGADDEDDEADGAGEGAAAGGGSRALGLAQGSGSGERLAPPEGRPPSSASATRANCVDIHPFQQGDGVGINDARYNRHAAAPGAPRGAARVPHNAGFSAKRHISREEQARIHQRTVISICSVVSRQRTASRRQRLVSELRHEAEQAAAVAMKLEAEQRRKASQGPPLAQQPRPWAAGLEQRRAAKSEQAQQLLRETVRAPVPLAETYMAFLKAKSYH
jgi:hypothetical protein